MVSGWVPLPTAAIMAGPRDGTVPGALGVSASIHNMYGPHGRAQDDQLTTHLAREFGCEREILLTYKAVYAIASASLFTADGSDGHFAWCTAILNRPDVRAAVS